MRNYFSNLLDAMALYVMARVSIVLGFIVSLIILHISASELRNINIFLARYYRSGVVNFFPRQAAVLRGTI